MRDLTFGQALECIKRGERVTRDGWNGPNQFVVLFGLMDVPAPQAQEGGAGCKDACSCCDSDSMSMVVDMRFLAIKTTQGLWQPWQPTHSDLLASDWRVI